MLTTVLEFIPPVELDEIRHEFNQSQHILHREAELEYQSIGDLDESVRRQMTSQMERLLSRYIELIFVNAQVSTGASSTKKTRQRSRGKIQTPAALQPDQPSPTAPRSIPLILPKQPGIMAMPIVAQPEVGGIVPSNHSSLSSSFETAKTASSNGAQALPRPQHQQLKIAMHPVPSTPATPTPPPTAVDVFHMAHIEKGFPSTSGASHNPSCLPPSAFSLIHMDPAVTTPDFSPSGDKLAPADMDMDTTPISRPVIPNLAQPDLEMETTPISGPALGPVIPSLAQPDMEMETTPVSGPTPRPGVSFIDMINMEAFNNDPQLYD
jgi:hypothetical protein